MVNRVGQLAGLALLLLTIARLTRLIQVGSEVPQWLFIVLAATLLGATVQWLLTYLRAPSLLSGVVLGFGGMVLLLRVAVPETLSYGFVPGPETWPELMSGIETATRVIRHGIPPVAPEPALIALLALLMWCLGAIYMAGAIHNRLGLMLIPSGITYLQFAVFDRISAGLGWMVASAAVLALCFAALSVHRRQQVGAVRDSLGRAQAMRSVAAPLAMASIVGMVSVVGAHQASAMVSEYGNLPFRIFGGSAGAPGSGGITFDRFVDLRQRLLSRENALLFQATVAPGSPPPGSLYWRMESLDVFDGVGWKRGSNQTVPYQPGREIGLPDNIYGGSGAQVTQRVELARLAGDLLPTAGNPLAIQEIEGDAINPRSVRFGSDGALFLPQGLSPESNYQLLTLYPQPELDLASLATRSDGTLSPLFAAAVESGQMSLEPLATGREVSRPPDLSFYTQVPRDTPAGLRAVAQTRTRGASTDFERAWMLEHWLRNSGDFYYSVNVTTGNGSLDLLAWLTDPNSPNYRTGYCEQFAATMALLGRLVGIPSRVVWGFTPGSVTNSDDGTPVIQVRDTNAHAWVEMWMDGHGWVKFDPTPGGQVASSTFTPEVDPINLVAFLPPSGVDTPDTPDDILTPVLPVDPDAPVELDPGRTNAARWPLYVLALALLGSVIPLMKRLRRQSRLERLNNGDITAAWDEIVDRLSDLGHPVDDNLTPIEFAAANGRELLPLAQRYSAAVYGDRQGYGRADDLLLVETWVESNFEKGQLVRARFNPRSLLKRR